MLDLQSSVPFAINVELLVFHTLCKAFFLFFSDVLNSFLSTRSSYLNRFSIANLPSSWRRYFNRCDVSCRWSTIYALSFAIASLLLIAAFALPIWPFLPRCVSVCLWRRATCQPSLWLYLLIFAPVVVRKLSALSCFQEPDSSLSALWGSPIARAFLFQPQ